jgi:hypothetical protein
MANPRATPAYDDIDATYVTFIADNSTITYSATAVGGSAAVGKAVKLSAARTVALTTDGSHVKGKLIKVEADLRCTVQTEGYMTLPGGNGASLTLGKKIVGAVDGSSAGGFIREVATGTAAELGVAKGEIIDASTTTAVIVEL